MTHFLKDFLIYSLLNFEYSSFVIAILAMLSATISVYVFHNIFYAMIFFMLCWSMIWQHLLQVFIMCRRKYLYFGMLIGMYISYLWGYHVYIHNHISYFMNCIVIILFTSVISTTIILHLRKPQSLPFVDR